MDPDKAIEAQLARWLGLAPRAGVRRDAEGALDALRSAVAPLVVPSELAAFYSRYDGTTVPVYYDVNMANVGEILSRRRLNLDVLGPPPAWLVFGWTEGGGGPFLFTTLDVSSCPTVEGVWVGDSHDAPLYKVFDSVAAMFATLGDVVQERHVPPEDAGDHLATLTYTNERDYRLTRSPSAWARGRSGTPDNESRIAPGDDWPWPCAWLHSWKPAV